MKKLSQELPPASCQRPDSHTAGSHPPERISRRGFGRRLLALGGAAAVGYGWRPGGALPAGAIDIHTHVGQPWSGDAYLTAEDLLRWMDRVGIARAAVLPLISPEARTIPIATHFVLEQTRPHRDRLIPFCSIDPRTVDLRTYEAKLELLARYRDAGARGFGEHKPGVAIDDPRNLELFAACAEMGFPALIHMDTFRNVDVPGLPGLERVLRQVPDTNFIGHAQGFWASISGEVRAEEMQQYPEGKVAPGGALDRLMDAYPNLYGDLSANSGANAILRDPEFGRAFLIRRADRLLFGTDHMRHGQNIRQIELYGRLDLPAAVEAKIFRENARRLLGLESGLAPPSRRG